MVLAAYAAAPTIQPPTAPDTLPALNTMHRHCRLFRMPSIQYPGSNPASVLARQSLRSLLTLTCQFLSHFNSISDKIRTQWSNNIEFLIAVMSQDSSHHNGWTCLMPISNCKELRSRGVRCNIFTSWSNLRRVLVQKILRWWRRLQYRRNLRRSASIGSRRCTGKVLSLIILCAWTRITPMPLVMLWRARTIQRCSGLPRGSLSQHLIPPRTSDGTSILLIWLPLCFIPLWAWTVLSDVVVPLLLAGLVLERIST